MAERLQDDNYLYAIIDKFIVVFYIPCYEEREERTEKNDTTYGPGINYNGSGSTIKRPTDSY